jgi:hypothetical protein
MSKNFPMRLCLAQLAANKGAVAIAGNDAGKLLQQNPRPSQSNRASARKIIYMACQLFVEQNEILADEQQKALEISYDRCYL